MNVEIIQLQQEATQCLQLNRYSEAIAYYYRCIQVNPTLMSNHWYLGLALLLSGEVTEAQDIWVSALTREGSDDIEQSTDELLAILKDYASQCLYQQKFEFAEQIYHQIVELEPEQPDTYHQLGFVLSQQGRYDDAIDCWQHATYLDPNLRKAYYSQAEVFQALGNDEEAIKCYSTALNLQADYSSAYQLGVCFSRTERLDLAINYFKDAITLKPDSAQAYGDLGIALLKQDNLDEAIEALSHAVSFQTQFTQAYSFWVNDLKQSGRSNTFLETIHNFLKGLQLPPQLPEVYVNLGKLLNENFNSSNTLISIYQKALQLNPALIAVYLGLGNALMKQGKIEQALSYYQQGIKLQPDSADLQVAIGHAFTQGKNSDDAIAAYQTALSIDPSKHEIYSYLGHIFFSKHQSDEAFTLYETVLEFQPDLVPAHINLALISGCLGNSQISLAYFQRAIDINPDCAANVYPLMMMLKEEQYIPQEDTAFQAVLPVEPPTTFYEQASNQELTTELQGYHYVGLKLDNIIHLNPPKSLDQCIHFSFRFGSQVELPQPFIVSIPKGRFWLNAIQDASAVMTANNQLIADLSPDFPVLSPGHPDKDSSKHAIFTVGKLPSVQRIEGTVAVLAGLLNNVYFHWMFDVLPRIALLENGEINFNRIDAFLVSHQLPFQQETLLTLGIPATKILEVSQYHHVQADTLVVPSFPGSVAWMPKWVCEFLRQHFLSPTYSLNKTERLYISRRSASDRRIINEQELTTFLEGIGFKCVTLESLSVAQQAALLASAEVVISPHGSGLSNIVFCQPGTKVIELFSPNYVYPCYWLISNLVELEYYYLLGETPLGFQVHKLFYPRPQIEDIYVDLEKLADLLLD
jgi:tetratricopeptide (TPR) repeat protein/capsular polysaccharide biosynthesis protein